MINRRSSYITLKSLNVELAQSNQSPKQLLSEITQTLIGEIETGLLNIWLLAWRFRLTSSISMNGVVDSYCRI
jgi:RNase P/RNase MRP subunit POP5